MSDTPETAPGRRWYHLRPEPRRRTDLMGFSSTLWMTVGWLIVIVVIFFPFPWCSGLPARGLRVRVGQEARP